MSLVCGQRSLLQSRWHIGVDVQKSVWQRTLKEVETGALVGPISLDEVDATFPLSRRFGVQQGQKVRCVDDFTRSGVNAWAQVVESPRPHKLDTIAALCMSLLARSPSKEQWKCRFFTSKPTGTVRSTHFRPTLLFLTLEQRLRLPSG